ncbi:MULTISPECIES: AMP-binding protein [Rhizobium/Agrobacterium group]
MVAALESPSVDNTTPANLIEALIKQSAAHPAKVYGSFDGQVITFGALNRAAGAFANTLRGRGVKRGDHVVVMMRNSAASLAIVCAILRYGNVWVPANAGLVGAGLSHVIDTSSPSIIIADAEFADAIAQSGRKSSCPVYFIEDPLLPEGDEAAAEPCPELADLAAIMFTSGTTGPAKGVMVSHLMLSLATEAAARCADVKSGDVLYVWEPIYHIGGAQLIFLPVARDASLAMVRQFSARNFWPQVCEAHATQIHYLGGILQILLKQPPSDQDRQHRVRVAWGGGCAIEIWRAFEERFGVTIRECYGMTEASSLTTFNSERIVGSVGQLMPWFDVKIIDDHGVEIAPGQGRGEIVINTQLDGAIFRGYYRNEQATASALRPSGYHTGDIGSQDDVGNLYFHGRKSDSVRCKGENVSAFEVEHIAGQHPSVEDCAMVGVRADVGEQDILLFVKPRQGEAIDPAEFIKWLTGKLAPYQVPRYVSLIEEFERTPSQRIKKHALPLNTPRWDRYSKSLTKAVSP